LIALGPAFGRAHARPVSNEAIQGSSYASLSGRSRFETVASADAEHPALRRANKLDGVKFYQVIKSIPASRAWSRVSPIKRRCCSKSRSAKAA
jgi:hypothetical protein